MKIALVQQRAQPNNRERNLQLALRYIRQAAEMGADLVLFPEMWSNGYAPPFDGAMDDPTDPAHAREREAWLADAVREGDVYLSAVADAAKRFAVGVCITALEQTEAGYQNAARLYGRGGNQLLRYVKVHTCDFSMERLLRHGTEFPVCEFEGVKIGVMICYDREFPESARVLMLNGAELILVPNACDLNPHRINQLNARAFENMVGVAMANYPGPGWGQSCAFSPVVFDEAGIWQDNTILRASDIEQGLLLAEFNLPRIRAFRAAETWGNAFRKPEAYAPLTATPVWDWGQRGS